MWLCINVITGRASGRASIAGGVMVSVLLQKSDLEVVVSCDLEVVVSCDLEVVVSCLDGGWDISESVTFLSILVFLHLLCVLYIEIHNCHYYVPTIYHGLIINVYSVWTTIKNPFYS